MSNLELWAAVAAILTSFAACVVLVMGVLEGPVAGLVGIEGGVVSGVTFFRPF